MDNQKILQQFDSGVGVIGNLMDAAALKDNLAENAIPPEITEMTVVDYEAFLYKRRHLMARMIETYYKNL